LLQRAPSASSRGSIRRIATLKLNETAALLREKGEPVIHLGGGEPKSKAPIDAILNCTALLNTGDVKYTPADGIPALKKAIIRYTEEHYGRGVAPENVIVSSGAKQAIMVACCTPSSTPRTRSSSRRPTGSATRRW
jgi:aspartate aminotransferase